MGSRKNTIRSATPVADGRDGDPMVDLAVEQHGVVTRRQLLSANVTAKTVDRWVANGRLRPVYRGVYLLGSLRGPLEPKRSREMAAVLAVGPGAALSHRSAGRLWGLLRRPRRPNPVGGERTIHRLDEAGLPVVDVTIPRPARRERPGIRVHRPTDLSPNDVTRFDGLPVTTPERTIRDLSTMLDARDLNRVAALAERKELIDPADLRSLVAQHGSRPGAPVLRAALLGEDGLVLTRSEAEERFLDLIQTAGLPPAQVNATVEGYEVDFFWPKERVAVEVDGFAFHSSRGSFEADRRRDSDLEARGIAVLRITWRQVVRERLPTAARISRALGIGAARARRVEGERQPVFV